MRGLTVRTRTYPRPSRSITPGLNCSTSTSARATSGARRSRSPLALRSSIRLVLPRLSAAKATLCPSTCGECVRIISPPGGSILITSAPASASINVASGPGSSEVKSSTTMPASGCMIPPGQARETHVLLTDLRQFAYGADADLERCAAPKNTTWQRVPLPLGKDGREALERVRDEASTQFL